MTTKTQRDIQFEKLFLGCFIHLLKSNLPKSEKVQLIKDMRDMGYITEEDAIDLAIELSFLDRKPQFNDFIYQKHLQTDNLSELIEGITS